MEKWIDVFGWTSVLFVLLLSVIHFVRVHKESKAFWKSVSDMEKKHNKKMAEVYKYAITKSLESPLFTRVFKRKKYPK